MPNHEIVAYLRARENTIITKLVNDVIAQPDLYPTYQNLDQDVIRRRIAHAVDDLLVLLSDGDLEAARNRVRAALEMRMRAGFNPNELLRTIDGITAEVTSAIEAMPDISDPARLYAANLLRMSQRIFRMTITTLNLTIPSNERHTIDSNVLK